MDDRKMETWLLLPRLEAVKPNTRIYIFGTGRGGSIVFDELTSRGPCEVVGFVDSVRTGHHHGLPLYDLESFIGMRSDDPVILATHAWREIAGKLLTSGVGAVFNGYDIIADHLAREARQAHEDMVARHRLRIDVMPEGMVYTLSASTRPG